MLGSAGESGTRSPYPRLLALTVIRLLFLIADQLFDRNILSQKPAALSECSTEQDHTAAVGKTVLRDSCPGWCRNRVSRETLN